MIGKGGYMGLNTMSLCEMYDAANFMFDWAEAFFHYSDNSTHFCKSCGTELYAAYLENRIYMVVCPCCETLTLVKAKSKDFALTKIGNKEIGGLNGN